MENAKQVAYEFLSKYKQTKDSFSKKEILEAFEKEIIAGLEGRESILPMVPSYLSLDVKPRKYEKSLLIDAGGTNLRVGTGYYNLFNKAKIKTKEQHPMMGVEKEVTKKEFFDTLYSYVKSYTKETHNIGFCFSYNSRMNENLEGVLNNWAKEIKAKEVVGQNINKCLEEVIYENDKTKHGTVILNDTVACALGSKALHKEKYSGYLGLIYGTGINVCYEEYTDNIKKISSSKKAMLINTECGDFNKFPHGVFDEIIISSSKLPLKGHLEKLSGGRYLSTQINEALKQAYKDGVINNKYDEKELREYSMFLAGTNEDLIKDEDKEFVKELSKILIDRAAFIVSCAVSAFALRSVLRNDKPLSIAVEGSTFYKLPYFKEYFEAYLKDLPVKHEITDGRGLIMLGSLLSSYAK